jgi:hypothetical protein
MRSSCEWENDIKIDLKETGYDSVDWIQSAQDMNQEGDLWT